MNQIASLPKRSLVDSMAAKYEMEPAAFMGAVKATCIKGDCSNEQFAAFLMVAKEYDLNPLTKEIYAFPDRGGITPIVSIDGWMNLINSHPQFDGMEFNDVIDDNGKLSSVECRMYRKDRQRPTSVIEYMSECFRQTDPWKKWPNRMLRHKAAIQCARYAFGFSGIMEPDEFERMKDVTPSDRPTVMDRLQSAQNEPQRPAGEVEGFSHAHVQRETHNVLTGEIYEPEPNDAPPEASGPDEITSPATEDAAVEPAPKATVADASSNLFKWRYADGELIHLRDFARKALDDATSDNDDAAKDALLEMLKLNYLDVISSDDGVMAINSIMKAVAAVVVGKRSKEQAALYIATEFFDVEQGVRA